MAEKIPTPRNEFMGDPTQYAALEKKIEATAALLLQIENARRYMHDQGFTEGLPLKVVNRGEEIQQIKRFEDATVALRIAALEDLIDLVIMTPHASPSVPELLQDIRTQIKNVVHDVFLVPALRKDRESVELACANVIKRVEAGARLADALHESLTERESMAGGIPLVQGTIDTKTGRVDIRTDDADDAIKRKGRP